MAKCLVIGGGLAGLSAAVFLKENGFEVELLEASPKLGGRSYSFVDSKTGDEIDNGQHIMMGVYESTFDYLEHIDTLHLPKFQKKLKINFRNKDQKRFSLNAEKGFYPFNLLFALLKYNALNIFEKIWAVFLIISLPTFSVSKLENISSTDWLRSKRQSINSIKSLWEIIGVGALNTKLDEAPATTFISLLRKIFLSGNKAATMVLTKVPLSKLFVEPALKYFNENNIKYSVSEKIQKMEILNNEIVSVISNKRIIESFEKVVLAIPPNSIGKIKANVEIVNSNIIDYEYSPIITVHFWTTQILFRENFIGLLDSKIHWIFNNGTHYSTVISAAEEILNLNPTEIFQIVLDELKEFFPNLNDELISHKKVLKEKSATIKSNFNNEINRSKLSRNISNLYFAGDWTNTGLPATIESAIMSGEITATLIKNI